VVVGLDAANQPCRILVVEDQKDNRLLMLQLLEGVGLQVRLAANGAEAVSMFERWRPHFIWMDRRMPVMDGIEATRKIRTLPGGDKVRIAVVTASSFSDEDAELKAAGLDIIVHKPFRQGRIFEVMEQQLGIRFLRKADVGCSDKDGDSAPQRISPQAMAALPLHQTRALADNLRLMSSKRIREAIDDIGRNEPELARVLTEHARRFNYEAILDSLPQLALHDEAKET